MFRQALLIVMAAAPVMAFAQAPLPNPPYYATNPNQPFAPSPQSPVQQQVLENYRTQLLQTQREMLQQNPSGLSRDQIEVNRQVNAFTPSYNPANPGYTAPPPPRYSPVRPYLVPTGRIPEAQLYRDEPPAWRGSETSKPKYGRPHSRSQPQKHPEEP